MGTRASLRPARTLVRARATGVDVYKRQVNGEPATIEKVDDGLMAVCVPAGENEIEFTYHTPGLKVSATVSAVAIVVYGVYLGILRKKKRA